MTMTDPTIEQPCGFFGGSAIPAHGEAVLGGSLNHH
jgi:hypothetical protein